MNAEEKLIASPIPLVNIITLVMFLIQKLDTVAIITNVEKNVTKAMVFFRIG